MTRLSHFEAKYKDGLTDRINTWISEKEEESKTAGTNFSVLNVQIVWVADDNYRFKGFVLYTEQAV